MNDDNKQVLGTMVEALAQQGIVRTSDVRGAEPIVAELKAERVIEWASNYGYDAEVAERVRRACKQGTSVRIVGKMHKAYIAAVLVVLVAERRTYNRGELAELAAAILLGLFPLQGLANHEPATTGKPDLVLSKYGLSCKNVAARCTFVHGDKADRLLAMLGNVETFYILDRATWGELEAKFAETDSSRGSKRSPRSKKSIVAMVEWLEAHTA